MSASLAPVDQSAYQVRFEWGADGLARLAPADLVVVVDVLRFSSTVIRAVDAGTSVPLDDAAFAVSINGAPIAAAVPSESLVALGALRNADAVARWVLAQQESRGARTSVSIIAAGERVGADGPVRFAVEDQLGAGAIIAALGDLGIDHCSPDAAVAGEGFRALRPAVRHLVSASGSGRELADRELRDDVAAASALNASTVVPVLRGGVFSAA